MANDYIYFDDNTKISPKVLANKFVDAAKDIKYKKWTDLSNDDFQYQPMGDFVIVKDLKTNKLYNIPSDSPLIFTRDNRTGDPIQINKEIYDRYKSGDKTGLEALFPILEGQSYNFDDIQTPQVYQNEINKLNEEKYKNDPLFQGYFESSKTRATQQDNNATILRDMLLNRDTIAGQRANLTAEDLAREASKQISGPNSLAGIRNYGNAVRQLSDDASQAAQAERLGQLQTLSRNNLIGQQSDFTQSGVSNLRDINKMDWALRRDQLINNYLNMAHNYKQNEINRKLEKEKQNYAGLYSRIGMPDRDISVGKPLATSLVSGLGTIAGAFADNLNQQQQYPSFMAQGHSGQGGDYDPNYGYEYDTDTDPINKYYDLETSRLESLVNRG